MSDGFWGEAGVIVSPEVLEALEAERHDITYLGHPKRNLEQLQAAVEKERYLTPR